MVDGGHSLGSGDTVNIFNGDAEIVVQFRDIYGDIHLSAPPRPTPVERAAHALAEAVFRQWREEAKVWDVGGDRPALAVHWKPRTRRADHTENVGGTVRGQGDRPEDLLTAFLGLRQRRLAILGDAGSGKTALAVLLTLDLLRRRLTGGGERLPVPVLLSLASWVPDREEFGAWFTRRLAEDYPGLPRVEGRHPARELWSGSASVLLPVLDGLDEMPGERRSTAVKALNRALYDGRPLILTCRTAEFDGLWSEVVLRSAAVIEARPIAVDEAVRYLTLSIAPKLLRRWDTVFAQISGRPDGAMATALSTPLMLWLARTVYAQEWTNPAELTEEARFPSRQSIENHLLDGFVPSVFTGEIPSDDRWEPPHRWSAVRARRYLHALARHLHQQRTTELAWWRLHRATAPRLLALPTLAVLGVLVSEAVTMLGRLFEGAGGVSPGITSQLGGGVVVGLAVQLLIYNWYPTFRFGDPRRGRGLSRPVAALHSAVRATSPRRMLTAAPIPLLSVGSHLWFVASTSPEAGPAAWRYLAPGCMALAFVVAILFTAPSDTAEGATTPQDLMRGERIAALVTLLVIAPLIGISVGLEFWTESGSWAVLSGTAAWVGAAAILLLVSPWSRWTLARTSMALTGRAPWSLMRFLRDAHRQGVLRQTGGTYQFRNIRLQERLAGRGYDEASAGPQPVPDRRLLSPSRILHTPDGGIAVRLKPPVAYRWPLKAAVPLATLYVLVVAVWGGVDALPVLWLPAAFFLLVGVVLSALTRLRPRGTVDLKLTPHHIEWVINWKQRARYDWTQVDAITVRETKWRGFEFGLYSIQLRLHPEASRQRSLQHSDGGWYLVCVLGPRPVVPPQLEEALRNFAEARWRHPLLSPLSPELSDQWEPQPAPDDAPPVPAFAPTPGGEPGQQLSRAAEETLPDTQGAWIKGILAFTLVASATVPVMAGRWLVGGSSGVPWATMVIYVIGQPVLTRYGPLGHEGRPAVFLRRLWGLASVLSLGAVLSVTVPARPLTWADILGMVVLGIGGLLFAYGVGYARSGQRHGLEYNIVGFGTVLAGCSAAPAAAASHGAVAFAGYAVATLLVFAGAISAPRKVPDMTLAASVSATTAPRLTALERAWDGAAVPLAMVAGATYAILAGETAGCWVFAAGTVFLSAVTYWNARLAAKQSAGPDTPPGVRPGR